MIGADAVGILGGAFAEQFGIVVVAVDYGNHSVADADAGAEPVLRHGKFLGQVGFQGILRRGVFEIEHLVFPVGQTDIQPEI